MLFPVESVPLGPPIETKKALLLLDFQNDFVSPEGNLTVTNVQSFLPNLPSLVAEFRAKGEVIWVGTEYRQPRSTVSPATGSHSILLKQFLRNHESISETSEYFDDPGHTRSPSEDPLSPSPKPDVVHDREAFLAPVMTMTRHRCCRPGSRGAEYPDVIKAAIDSQQDLVLLKSHYSAFVDTPLLMHLRTRTITELYICGSISNISVYATVLDAVCHGLQVTIIEDFLGYNDEKCHVEAMRQMADDMGASGVDCQELRDDLAGLLGDVVREEDFTTSFQVSLPPPARRTVSHTSREHINDWISHVDTESISHANSYLETGCAPQATVESGGIPSKRSEEAATHGRDSYVKSESSRISVKPTSIERSPPRKRSTSDLDSLEEDRIPKLSHKPSTRRTSNGVYLAEQLKQKQTKQSTTRKRRPSHETLIKPFTPTTNTAMVQSPSAENIRSNKESPSEDDQVPAEDTAHETNGETLPTCPKKKKKLTPNVLGPGDKIGQGDCQLFAELLGESEAEAAFYSCRESIKWQKMYHRSGEVPRLVAVQGAVFDDGAQIPIYRHPADESPELLPFNGTVDVLRQAAEKVVGHPLNHVLIQWYRNSEDNISEHSDKTLDIVRGSSIVNVSLGAQRTMTLRTKKSASTAPSENLGDSTRESQRIPLPHNSLFILGQDTNQHWLHAIRADKRLPSEKDPAELAFDSERISLTFRQIGTFINPAENRIWGQGGTSKTREGAKKLLKGTDAEREGENMIRAFGQENHRSANWDWDEWYGKGFDVVNFETKET